MKTRTSVAILGALFVGIASLAAGARAASRPSVTGTSDVHTAPTVRTTTMAAPGVSPPAPPPPAEPAAPSRLAPVQPDDALDWSNPYDLMLHGKSLGRMRDMR